MVCALSLFSLLPNFVPTYVHAYKHTCAHNIFEVDMVRLCENVQNISVLNKISKKKYIVLREIMINTNLSQQNLGVGKVEEKGELKAFQNHH